MALTVLMVADAFADVTVLGGDLKGVRGCSVVYEHHVPAEPATQTTVILAHGFRRDLETMRGWAKHWSELGIPVVIPSLCNSSWFAGRHDRNADDLVALRESLGIESVVYAGFSAGALAAYLAALKDSATIAYLGLDPVDNKSLASGSPAGLEIPARMLLADSSACNARNNFLAVIEQWGYPHEFVKGATHCHFEWPYDPRCAWLCGRRDEEETSRALAAIRESASRWLMSTIGIDRQDPVANVPVEEDAVPR